MISYRGFLVYTALCIIFACKPKSQGLDKPVKVESRAEQEKYSYSKSPVPIKDPKTAVVYFGIVPDTSPQPGTYRHLKYVSLENQERSVFVDTQYESFSDWSEFSKIHVVLPPELWSEGKRLSNENGLKLSHEDNSIPVIITGVSMVAGVGLAGILFGRIKSLENPVYKNIGSEFNYPVINKAKVIPPPAAKNTAPVFSSPTKSSKDSGSHSTKTEETNREIVPYTPSGSSSSSILTVKTPPSTKSWTEWVQENRVV